MNPDTPSVSHDRVMAALADISRLIEQRQLLAGNANRGHAEHAEAVE